MNLIVSKDNAELIGRASKDFEARVNELLSSQPKVRVLLTGGTLGIEFIAAMKGLRIDYSKVWLMFSDERFVPLTHPDRNEHQAIGAWSELEQYLLRYPDSNQALSAARVELEGQISKVFEDGHGIDITILGMGPDGHVASLFPGHDQPGDWVIAEPSSPKPPAERLSLSYRALEQSGEVWFLASGESKAAAVSSALNSEELPAGRVRGKYETRWYLDAALNGAL